MEPKLYIIMRRDIQDGNPGKMMAQAAHAQADFNAWMHRILHQPSQYSSLLLEFARWRGDRSFGATVVLHETLDTIGEIVENTAFSGKTVDPSYRWRNHYGDVFVSNEVTCAWVFVCQQSISSEEKYMGQFKLHS